MLALHILYRDSWENPWHCIRKNDPYMLYVAGSKY